MPRVSVVIPCYNLGRFLDEAVDSVLAQTFQDFEIVVVDDGSTDEGTKRLLADYRKPRTRVVQSPNRGLPAAKNLGLAETTGPYVCMLDADDRLDPQLLAKSVAALDGDPSVAFVSHWLRTFGDETWDWTPARCDFPALLDTNTVNGAALVRRTALEAVGGFDESMREGCEDWDLWIALVERGLKGAILPEILFHYRRRPDSMSRLMMQGDGHPRLYRRLAEKHARAYATHISPLVTRREEDLTNLRRHIHDLALQHYRWLGPELTKWRSDVEVLERKTTRVARQRAEEDERARLNAALEASQHERKLQEQRFQAEEQRFRAETQRFQAEAQRFQAETHRFQTEERRFQEEQARSRAAADEERLRAENHARAFETARDRALELDASFNRARNEVDGLRRSISWRATAPLRAVYSGLVRLVFGDGR
jgi:glycosyltransferase involved in cell wall biosynthesis